MKKLYFIATLFALVMSSAMLTSCGDDEPTIKENQLTKLGETVKLYYAGIFKDEVNGVYSIFITNDNMVDLTKEVGTPGNPGPSDFVAIDIPFKMMGKRIKDAYTITDSGYYFGACVDNDLVWFDWAPYLVSFNGYVNYDKDGVLTVDISATNDYTKAGPKLKKLAKESVKVTFQGEPVIASEKLYDCD